MDLVFLPATAPGDTTYGSVPKRVEGHPGASITQVRYPRLVWYNEAVRREAITQIRALRCSQIVLVGFSKSGLGAWNIARAIPEMVAGTIIFDAPVTQTDRHRWPTEAFYPDDASWQRDLPSRTVREFRDAMCETHRLVLISGASFHNEMCALSNMLTENGLEHIFLPRPGMKHHWNAGWIEEGLARMR